MLELDNRDKHKPTPYLGVSGLSFFAFGCAEGSLTVADVGAGVRRDGALVSIKDGVIFACISER